MQCWSDGDEAHDLTPQLHAELRGKGQPEVARQTGHENHRRSANASSVDARVHQSGISEPIRECSSLLRWTPARWSPVHRAVRQNGSPQCHCSAPRIFCDACCARNRHCPQCRVFTLDLATQHAWDVLKSVLSTCEVAFVHMAPPCGTCSKARGSYRCQTGALDH